jgi:hypothetical protein
LPAGGFGARLKPGVEWVKRFGQQFAGDAVGGERFGKFAPLLDARVVRGGGGGLGSRLSGGAGVGFERGECFSQCGDLLPLGCDGFFDLADVWQVGLEPGFDLGTAARVGLDAVDVVADGRKRFALGGKGARQPVAFALEFLAIDVRTLVGRTDERFTVKP